jgi:hypothetical protein
MAKDLKINPLGNLMASLYSSGQEFHDITPAMLLSIDETALTPKGIHSMSDRIYDAALKCAAVSETRESLDKKDSSLKKQRNALQLELDSYIDSLRHVLDIWFYSLGSRAPAHPSDEKRRPLYSCTSGDISFIYRCCQYLERQSNFKKDGQHQFFLILVQASGRLINFSRNAHQQSASLKLELEKVVHFPLLNSVPCDVPHFDVNIHTLYICKGLIRCVRNHHAVACTNALIPTVSGSTVLLNVNYCSDCQRFYISYDAYEFYIEKYKSLLTKFVLEGSQTFEGHFDHLADSSPLKLCGYSVSKEAGFSQEEREKILYEMISNRIITKPEAIQYLEWFIHLNGKSEFNWLANEKWKSDLSYVRGLNLVNQTNHIIDLIKPYR